MKTCTKCLIAKSTTEFRKQTKSKDGASAWCKRCFNEYERLKYETSKERRLSIKETAAERRIRNAKHVWSVLLESECLDCGEADPEVLEFDHRDRDTKLGSISEMASGGQALEKIKAEIAKCDVRCVKCHRKRTAKQFGWRRWLNEETE